MEKTSEKPITEAQKPVHPLLLLLEEQKEIMAAVRAGKPASSVPTIKERLKKKNG